MMAFGHNSLKSHDHRLIIPFFLPHKKNDKVNPNTANIEVDKPETRKAKPRPAADTIAANKGAEKASPKFARVEKRANVLDKHSRGTVF